VAHPKAGSRCSSAGSARAIVSRFAGALPASSLPTPIATKAGSMPRHRRFRLDNRNDRQDRWKPSIHLDEEPAIVVGRLSATPHPAPQDDQRMSEHRILRLKPALRLERRGQHGQNKTKQPDHSVSLGDSIRSSTQIRFSVHRGSSFDRQSTERNAGRGASPLRAGNEMEASRKDREDL
jgi:hypothetical protein